MIAFHVFDMHVRLPNFFHYHKNAKLKPFYAALRDLHQSQENKCFDIAHGYSTTSYIRCI